MERGCGIVTSPATGSGRCRHLASGAACHRGQATVEAVVGIGALMLAGLLCFQLLATGYSASIADGAAAAGAVALVRGEPVEPAVRKALPGWARERISVSRIGWIVRVRLRPPALFPSMSDALEVSAEAGARPG